jgi:hypothetical protein
MLNVECYDRFESPDKAALFYSKTVGIGSWLLKIGLINVDRLITSQPLEQKKVELLP